MGMTRKEIEHYASRRLFGRMFGGVCRHCKKKVPNKHHRQTCRRMQSHKKRNG